MLNYVIVVNMMGVKMLNCWLWLGYGYVITKGYGYGYACLVMVMALVMGLVIAFGYVRLWAGYGERHVTPTSVCVPFFFV